MYDYTTTDELSEEEQAQVAVQLGLGDSGEDLGYGYELIAESYFVQYTTELIVDVYDNDVLNSSEWPWRHLQLDYEAAASELEQDYTYVELDGVEYFAREI